jgi:voltage-gated potassium channel
MHLRRNIFLALGSFAIVIAIGTVGYVWLEGASGLDALYMTVISVTTVGYSEVVNVDDPAGKIFTMFIIVSGFGAYTFFAISVITYLVEKDFHGEWLEARIQKRIGKMRDHYIICGLGQAGTAALEEFLAARTPCVVIEKNAETVRQLRERYAGLGVIVGDATSDDILRSAGVEHARGLIAATESDSVNLLTVLTARSKNPGLVITSRATRNENVNKLRIAGANHVIMPNKTGGIRMAATLLRPDAVNFLEIMIRGTGDLLQVEQAEVPVGSPAAGQTLMDLAIPNRTGLLVLAIKRAGGEDVFNHKPTEVLNPGDVLIVMGEADQIPVLKEMLRSGGK